MCGNTRTNILPKYHTRTCILSLKNISEQSHFLSAITYLTASNNHIFSVRVRQRFSRRDFCMQFNQIQTTTKSDVLAVITTWRMPSLSDAPTLFTLYCQIGSMWFRGEQNFRNIDKGPLEIISSGIPTGMFSAWGWKGRGGGCRHTGHIYTYVTLDTSCKCKLVIKHWFL